MTKKIAKAKKITAKQVSTSVRASKSASSVSPAKPTVKLRAARGHAKASILSSLATGPKSRDQLMKAGKLSAPVFYLNLKQLKETKQIAVEGRRGLIRLLDTTTTPESESSSKSLPALRQLSAARLAVIPEFVSGDLHDALEAVNARFMAMDRVGEKLHTLEQLSRSLPSPVSDVLMSIHSDLLRLSPARAPR